MGLSLTPCTWHTRSARRLRCSRVRSQHVLFEMNSELLDRSKRIRQESSPPPKKQGFMTQKLCPRGRNRSEETYLSCSSSSSKRFDAEQHCCSVRLRASMLWDSDCWGWSVLLTDVLPTFSTLSLLISLDELPSPKNLLFFCSALCTGILGDCW